MLVDQCVSEAVICLAAVLLWVGRWERYPYQPSGQPGMDDMRPWPSAGARSGDYCPPHHPSSAAIFTDMSNNESGPM